MIFIICTFNCLTRFDCSLFALDDLDENRNIQHMQNMILKCVRNASLQAIDYMKTFSKYEYIWLDNKREYLQRFLSECQRTCLEDNDCVDDELCDPNAQVELFQAQVHILSQ